ncbi:2-dehydropantoate 2-reductase [Pseudoxanthomonas broegbernensis]|uniref:2-dehydropantoate 2-reductase n=1 Tax=Pseudoxanthomonas broegbernensis TaxID=83619 RepID=A0A7V8GN68_9GAMM|nr:2-dehydropantoate 2-reductase [Pseudoxanthomonas broegbernensis]KAF1686847.1 2-dehydropantoate 2-reductase [Pseudoxanthomonas broegbernensis]MBB6065565.1 2-dehydropantoate 2-reductase [Pseudoxanthomonas broegbernensis]
MSAGPRILVLGAGGTGGYFGGRLAQSGADVAFLVRPARAAALRERGLRIRSPLGDAELQVATVTADALPARAGRPPFDLVVLSCKAYDLDSAIEAVAPAVGPDTVVLPILNGLLHYDALDARFGRARVLGGLCFIGAALGADGEVLHLGKPASITFGLREGNRDTGVLAALAAAYAGAGVDHLYAPDIARAQWIKFSFLATLAAGTCLMRAGIGDIVASEGGIRFMAALHEECLSVAAAEGQPVPADEAAIARKGLTRAGSPVTASMLRDLRAGQRVEALQIVGDMVHRAQRAGLAVPRLEAAWSHLQVYEAGRSEG